MFGETFLKHFSNPVNVGILPGAALDVTAANPACGDELRLTATLEDGRIAEVRYLARGCTASIAAGSALTELLCGRTRFELAAIRTATVEEALGGLTAETRHAAVLCADAVKALHARWPVTR